VGDGWKSDVQKAVYLIQMTDTAAYNILNTQCNNIEFIDSEFSTTKRPHTIALSIKDMKLNSINNIAAALVHESYHLYLYNNNVKLSETEEELKCYMEEYEFICKLPNVEEWLFMNTINKLIYYQNNRNKRIDKF
jgi:hypothetical protein